MQLQPFRPKQELLQGRMEGRMDRRTGADVLQLPWQHTVEKPGCPATDRQTDRQEDRQPDKQTGTL